MKTMQTTTRSLLFWGALALMLTLKPCVALSQDQELSQNQELSQDKELSEDQEPSQDKLSQDKDKKEKEKKPIFRFEFKNRPSLRIGKIFRLDVRSKVQGDFRAFLPGIPSDGQSFDVNRARLSIEGDAFKFIEYEVERDFRQALGSNEARYPWKDVYLNFRYFDNYQVKYGKFKMPFGADALTGEHQNDFAFRSRIGDDLAPGRAIGGMLHGRFFKRGLSYQTGVFQHDGENAQPHNGQPLSGPAFAARVTGTPLRFVPFPKNYANLELGAAYTTANVPEGLNSVRGHTVPGDVYYPYVFLKGPRQRVGLEANWTAGRYSVKSEYISMTEARHEQSVFLTDLPNEISRGWYVTGTWVLTGEPKDGGVVPKRSFLAGGFGALEAAARYEQERFGTLNQFEEGFTSPRSQVLRAQSDRVWTLGINWYANRVLKVQLDGVHEKIEQAIRAPIPGRNNYWTGIVRFQFVM